MTPLMLCLRNLFKCGLCSAWSSFPAWHAIWNTKEPTHFLVITTTRTESNSQLRQALGRQSFIPLGCPCWPAKAFWFSLLTVFLHNNTLASWHVWTILSIAATPSSVLALHSPGTQNSLEWHGPILCHPLVFPGVLLFADIPF